MVFGALLQHCLPERQLFQAEVIPMVVPSSQTSTSTIPEAAAKPRKPVEWTFVIRGKRKLMQVGVFSENRTEDMRWWISKESTKAEKKKRSSGSGDANGAANGAVNGAEVADTPAAQAPADPAANGANTLYLHVKEGENEEVYQLSPEDAAKYQQFADEFNGKRGIYILREVRGSKVVGLPTKTKYFLSPRRTTEAIMPDAPSPGQNVVAYALFQRKLETDNRVLIAHYFHGKGFSPVFITASDQGLVMVQLPLISQFHAVNDAIDPAWKAVKPEASLREAFAEFFATLSSAELDPADFQHPERVLLQNLVVQKRDAAEPRVDSDMYREGGFTEALEAMIQEAGASVEVEAPKKPQRKPAAKTTAGGGTAPKRTRKPADPK